MAATFYRRQTDKGDFLVRAGDGLSALVYASESAWRARCGATNALEWTDPAKAAAFFAGAVEIAEPALDPLPEPDPEAVALGRLAASDGDMARAAEDAVRGLADLAAWLRENGIAVPEELGAIDPKLADKLAARAAARVDLAAARAERQAIEEGA